MPEDTALQSAYAIILCVMARSLEDISFFMLDMDGTIYLGNRLFPCTKPFLEYLSSTGRRFIFLTNNSSGNSASYVKRLASMGIDVSEDDVFSSGEATAIYAKKRFPGAKLAVMGTEALKEDFRKAGFELDEENPDALILGYDNGFTYRKMAHLCRLARRPIPYIATHPDLVVPTDEGMMPDIGAVMAYVNAAAGRMPDAVVGKPNGEIVDAVTEKYGVSREQTAMVGDRLYTDIALGANSGIASILLYSGETDREMYAKSEIRADFVFGDLGELQGALAASLRQGR